MLSTGAVVSGSGVALEGVTEVTAVQVVVPQVIMAPPEEGQQEGRFTVSYRSFFFFFVLLELGRELHSVCHYCCSSRFHSVVKLKSCAIVPDALFNGVSFVVLEIGVQLLQFEESLFPRGLSPGRVQRRGNNSAFRYRVGHTLHFTLDLKKKNKTKNNNKELNNKRQTGFREQLLCHHIMMQYNLANCRCRAKHAFFHSVINTVYQLQPDTI